MIACIVHNGALCPGLGIAVMTGYYFKFLCSDVIRGMSVTQFAAVGNITSIMGKWNSLCLWVWYLGDFVLKT